MEEFFRQWGLPSLGIVLAFLASLTKRNEAAANQDNAITEVIRHLTERVDTLETEVKELRDQVNQKDQALLERDRTIAAQAAQLVTLQVENAQLKAAGATA